MEKEGIQVSKERGTREENSRGYKSQAGGVGRRVRSKVEEVRERAWAKGVV